MANIGYFLWRKNDISEKIYYFIWFWHLAKSIAFEINSFSFGWNSFGRSLGRMAVTAGPGQESKGEDISGWAEQPHSLPRMKSDRQQQQRRRRQIPSKISLLFSLSLSSLLLFASVRPTRVSLDRSYRRHRSPPRKTAQWEDRQRERFSSSYPSRVPRSGILGDLELLFQTIIITELIPLATGSFESPCFKNLVQVKT